MPACLLCGNAKVEIVDQLSGAELRRMWKELGDEISERAFSPLVDDRRACLGECCSCGFFFFDPSLAGSGAFYEALSRRDSYYPVSNEDFLRAAEFAGRHQLSRVLDIGCGEGAFLDQLKGKGHKTHGIELNPAGAQRCREKGHHIFSKMHRDISLDETGGQFDLVSAFHVLEHVTDPVGFIKDAMRLARPGGFIAIAVPNMKGASSLVPLDPHEWPPHHVTRWRHQDLRLLAERCGLEMVEQGTQRTIGSQIRYLMHLNNRMARLLGRKEQVRSDLVINAAGYLYTLFGAKYWTPHIGRSGYAFFGKKKSA